MPNTTTFVVVGDKRTLTTTNVIESQKYNVVDYRWVLQCIERKAFEFPAMQHVSEIRGRGGGGGFFSCDSSC